MVLATSMSDTELLSSAIQSTKTYNREEGALMDIQQSFDDSVRNSSLPDAMADITESSIDSLLDNELLKQIPIVKIFMGLTRVGLNIHDKLFLKKIISFLQGIDEFDPEARNEMINRIDDSRKYRLKVGEKLLYIIDSCDDYESSERVAKLFGAFLKERISYDKFMEAASIVARLSRSELKLFIDSYNISYMDDTAQELVHTGLVYIETQQVEVDVEKVERTDPDEQEYYRADVSGGDTTVVPTSAGDTVFEVFGIGQEARRKQMEEEARKRREKWEEQSRNRIQNLRTPPSPSTNPN